MEPTTLITTALTLAYPYLAKTGEKVAEKIGEDIWNILKKPFNKKEKEELFSENPNNEQLEKIKYGLIVEVEKNQAFKNELIETIKEADKSLNQQNIYNRGKVKKQVNIQSNSGDIKF